MKNLFRLSASLLLFFAASLWLVDIRFGDASSHREAPLISEDPTADNTDVYAFVSPDQPNTVTLIANWIPLEEPAGGPNFHTFDPNARYEIKIDNDGDAVEDIVYRFTFQTQVLNPFTFLYNVGPITDLIDQNYNRRQLYDVTRIQGGTSEMIGSALTVPPVNIGPASTPNYEDLAQQGVYDLGNGIKVFAGQRDDPFSVDLGAVFDLLTIRPGPPGNAGGGVNGLGGFNIHSIALQVPIEQLTADGQGVSGPTDPDAVIGVWATTSRRNTRIINPDGSRTYTGDFVQVSRLGLPLVNEVIIPLGQKDRFNGSDPVDDGQFATFLLDPEVASLLNALYSIDVPPAPRTDLLPLLTGFDGLNRPSNVVPSEMLRLNMGIPPKSPGDAGFSTMGVLGGDNAGFPNGRRLYDDVVDIELQVLAGVLVPGFNVAPNNQLGDGVTGNDRPFHQVFPYLATPHQGFEHEHHPISAPPPPPPPAGCPDGLRIADFDADQGVLSNPADDFAEFISIEYYGAAAVSLDDCTLAFFDGFTSNSYFAMQLAGNVAPGGTHLVGNPGVPGVIQTFPNASLQNGPDGIAVLDRDASTVPNGTSAADAAPDVVAAVVYVDENTIFGQVPAAAKNAGDLNTMLRAAAGREAPASFALAANYPNPFNPSTVIPFDLPEAVHVRLTVFDLTGREVVELVDARREAGAYEVAWDGRDRLGLAAPSGVYIYRLEAGSFISSGRMILLK